MCYRLVHRHGAPFTITFTLSMCNYITLSVVVPVSEHMIQSMCQQAVMYCVSMYVLSNDRLGRCKAYVCLVSPIMETSLAHRAIASRVLAFS